MTEPDDAAHLGLERLADLDEGLLSPDEATAARAHLATCSQCRDDLSALASVRAALLADAEVPMPADIADRLYAALAAEPALTPEATAGTTEQAAGEPAAGEPATGEPATAPPSELAASPSVTTLPAQRGRTAWQRRRPAAALLAAVAGVALIAVGIVQLGNGSSDSAEKSGAAATTTPAPAPTRHTGQDYTDADLSAGALALLPGSTGATSAAAAATATMAAGATSGAAATRAAATEHTTYGAAATTGAAAAGPPATLTSAGGTSAAAVSTSPVVAATSAAAQVPGSSGAGSAAAASAAAPVTNATPAAGGGAPPIAASTPDVLAPLRAPGAAQACLTSLLPDAGPPLVIDYAAYNGKPAIIGVFHDPSRSGLLQVIAAGPPGCVLYTIKFPAAP